MSHAETTLRTAIGDSRASDFQKTSRAGVTLVFPLRPRLALRLAAGSGISIEPGGDFRTIGLNYPLVFSKAT